MKILSKARLTIPAGTPLVLSDDQFNARSHQVVMRGGQIIASVSMEFKAGEEIEVVGDMPKAVPESLYEQLDDDLKDEATDGKPAKPNRARRSAQIDAAASGAAKTNVDDATGSADTTGSESGDQNNTDQ